MSTIRQAQDAVCHALAVSRDDMLGAGRDVATVQARHAAMWLARSVTGQSYTVIAKAFGVDKQTAIYGAQRTAGRIADDSGLGGWLNDLARLLLGPAPVEPRAHRLGPITLDAATMAEIEAAHREAPHCLPYKSSRAWPT